MLTSLTTLQILAWLIYGLSLYLVLRRLSFRTLLNEGKVQHLVFGCTAAIFFLWIFRTGIYPGLNVHFLWLTALTLVLGFHWAIASSCLALVGLTLIGKESWAMFGVNGLLACLVPISCSYLCYSFAFHKLPRHLFIYIFVCAFLTGAIMIGLKMSLLSAYYYVNGDYSWMVIKDNYLILATLMLFMEGMLNGMTITLLIIYRPQWVYTYYDKYYLQSK